MVRIWIRPRPAASAIADPEMPEKIKVATMLTWAKPAGHAARDDERCLLDAKRQAAGVHDLGREDE
jgi:hypothetical protein